MEKVISCFRKRPEAAVRLICFPWAGGGSLHYSRWGNLLSPSTEVLAVRLPGREGRAREPFLENMQQVVEEVLEVLLPLLRDKPFALFGHSFGAFASFAFAHALKKHHDLEPVHLFVSGALAPYSKLRLNAPRRSQLSDQDFLRWLTSVGGTPPELLENPEVLKLFLPALKADLHIVENYRCEEPDRPLLSCSVSCFDGKEDVPHDLPAWRNITSGEFSIRMFEGSHFYLKDPENQKILLDLITKHLETAEMDYL
ncbi:S-acyl fatty acid synthase thioesterase, medium chain [Austrofundulus limnaeus]|uniref:S-acyl fatty acid synthase thioesterase, medium chain n=1 Tax=Austrofundulus limnaeus TaxID=52670 RepID=A0A2I4CMA9_AUSLI|nr:PREDICTED: S-acyl fatty acid synthase thioesterase, medium chain [Austrofundulus limnaeus]